MRTALIVACVALGFTEAVSAGPIHQTDRIEINGPYYRGDQLILNIGGKNPVTVGYTVQPDDEVGYNAYNAAKHWFEAISDNPFIADILDVAFLSPPDSASPDSLFITLEAKKPGRKFDASVSVIEACDCDLNESAPLVAISSSVKSSGHEQPTHIPEPNLTVILLVGLTATILLRKASTATNTALRVR